MAAHVPDDDGRAGWLRGSVPRLIAALLLVYLVERFLDLGVMAALVLATLFLGHGWIAAVLPLAGWLAADPEWRSVTILLYAAFASLAMYRNNPVAASVAFLIAAIEVLRFLI
jgi:hypothetical protein